MKDEIPDPVLGDRIAELEEELRQLKDEASSPVLRPVGHAAPDAVEDAQVAARSTSGTGDELPEGFALFTGRHRRAGGAIPRIAFQRRGNLSLNRAAFEALGSPEAVALAYSEGTREVAIKGASKELVYASPVRKQKAADSYLVAARAFTQSIQLNVEESVLVFDDVRLVQEGLVVVKLEEGRRLFTRKRNP